MSKVVNYSEYRKSNNIEELSPVSIEDHVAECKLHEIVYHGFQCPLCRTKKKYSFLDDLEDSFYFQGISPQPSKRTQDAIKRRKNHDKKTRTSTAKN